MVKRQTTTQRRTRAAMPAARLAPVIEAMPPRLGAISRATWGPVLVASVLLYSSIFYRADWIHLSNALLPTLLLFRLLEAYQPFCNGHAKEKASKIFFNFPNLLSI